MLSVELKHLHDILTKAGVQEDVADLANSLSKRIEEAVWAHGVSCSISSTVNLG